jgi:hypothetical protein
MNRAHEDQKKGELGLQLVQCPSQPGCLIISTRSCAERYELVHKSDHRFPKDEFGLALMSGLKTCRSCPEGRYFWQHKIWPHLPRRGPDGKRRPRKSATRKGKRGAGNEGL